MTRALPLCAHCGKKPPRGRGYILQAWTAVKGRPQVVWCRHCVDNPEDDPLFGHANQEAMPLASLLARIDARGPGRVSLLPPATIKDVMASAAKVEAT